MRLRAMKKQSQNKPNFKPDGSSAEATHGLPRTAYAPATTDVFMKSLRPIANFSSISTHIKEAEATVHVSGAYTKNKRDAVQWLRPDTTEELKGFFQAKFRM